MRSLEYFYEMSPIRPDQTRSDAARGARANTGDLRGLFRDHGLRCTRQREQIYTALAASKAHPTAEELLHIVRAAEGGLSLATVYNTLEAFTERGLCRRLPAANGSGACRFDADLDHHAHIALDDGRILDLPRDLGDRIISEVPRPVLDEIERRLGVRIDRVSLQLSGRRTDAS
jgi:Fe2+ or Zn2+ uptake regulation protein